jgi:hypothetical protein
MTHSANQELRDLADRAIQALLMQQPVPITRPAGWEREPGFPLPIKKMEPDLDGTTTQNYRPMALLEYVQEVLSGERKAAARRDAEATE